MNFKLRNSYKTIAGALLLSALSLSANAQESAPEAQVNPLDTLYPVIEAAQSDISILKKIKISGLIQGDYQIADTAGIKTKAGKDFDAGINNRMTIRRGRIKAAYENENTQGVIQLDITENGVSLKDAYLKFTDKWINTVSLTGGVFDRPFGNEIGYSSSSLETPERSRIIQELFPGEKDLGGMLTFRAPKISRWNFIYLDAGLFNGNGGTAKETDSYKDFIGHLWLGKANTAENFKWGIGGSYYNGGFATNDQATYSVKTINGVKSFVSDTAKVGSRTKKEYFGIDGQVSIDWWLGITQIRAEYLWGTQAGTSSSSASLSGALATTSNTTYTTTEDGSGKHVTTAKTTTGGTPVYSREFNGYYVYLIQNIFESPVQFVAKYDVYDPNTKLSGNEIGSVAKSGAADIKYSTLGLGLNYRWNSNVTFMAHYDIVTNETTNAASLKKSSTLSDLSKDRKDNVFTFRIQYKF